MLCPDNAVFIGPYDLSGSLGHPGEVTHSEVVEAIVHIREACSKANIPVGIFAGTIQAARNVREKTSLLAVGTDLMLLSQSIADVREVLKP